MVDGGDDTSRLPTAGRSLCPATRRVFVWQQQSVYDSQYAAALGQGPRHRCDEELVEFGFGELRLERIKLRVYDFNAGARRSYAKVGFSVEGTERHATFRRGTYHDDHIMSILRDEWLAQDRPRSWDLP